MRMVPILSAAFPGDNKEHNGIEADGVKLIPEDVAIARSIIGGTTYLKRMQELLRDKATPLEEKDLLSKDIDNQKKYLVKQWARMEDPSLVSTLAQSTVRAYVEQTRIELTGK